MDAIGEMTFFLKHHEDYLESEQTWDEISDFRDGSNEEVLEYLIPFESEAAGTAMADQLWKSRQRRLTNENDLEPLADVHLSHLAQPINWGDLLKNDQMALIIADADGSGNSAERVFHDCLNDFINHGKVGVLVDGTDAVAVSKAEVSATGERSYQVKFTARQIRYWETFQNGPRRGMFKEVVLDAPEYYDSETGKTYARVQRFVIPEQGANFIKEIYQADSDEITPQADAVELELKESVQGSLDRIPFVVYGRGLEESVMRMPAQLEKGLLNKRSQLDNIHYYQGHQRLVATGVVPEDFKTMAEFTVTCIANPDANLLPVPAGDPASIERKIDALELKLKRYGMKRLNELVSSDSKQTQSADSKALDQKALIKWYDQVLRDGERFLNAVFSFHAEYEGYTGPVAISIARDFGLDSPEDIRADRGIIFSQAGQLGARKVQQQILKQSLQEIKTIAPDEGQSAEDTKKALLAEVDSAQPEPSPYQGFNFGAQNSQ